MMNIPRCVADMMARRRAAYQSPPPANREFDEDYWFEKDCTAIVTAILNEITTFARCAGNDSRGDSHDNVGIV